MQASLVIDRDTASRLGITAQLIDDTLYDAFGQRQVSITYTPLNQYHVVMEVAPPYWQRPETLRDIYVHSPSGAEVPLSAFTHYEPTTTSLSVNHLGQFPAVTTSFNLAPGAALGDAVAAIESATREMGLPASIRGSFLGTAEAFKASLANEPYLILAALLAVYIVLGMLVRELRPPHHHPLHPAVGGGGSAVRPAGLRHGVEPHCRHRHHPPDRHRQEERHHDGGLCPGGGAQGRQERPEEAIYEACLLRFRPIMMTTMAALLGALPLALGTGVGSELRRPLGISIVGGLIFSQMLTLYTTPVIYLYLDRFRLWFNRLRGEAQQGWSADEIPWPLPGESVKADTAKPSGRFRSRRELLGSIYRQPAYLREVLFRGLKLMLLRLMRQSLGHAPAAGPARPGRWRPGCCSCSPAVRWVRITCGRPPRPPRPTKKMPAGRWPSPGTSCPGAEWWEIYNDPQLNALEEQVDISNQNIAAAEANFRQALALIRVARAAYFPTVTGGPSWSRFRRFGKPRQRAPGDPRWATPRECPEVPPGAAVSAPSRELPYRTTC